MSNFFRSHGMDSQYDYPSFQDAQNVKPSTAPRLTPYMGLRSRLSQIWFNKWTVLIALVVARVWLDIISLDGDIESARSEALSACTTLETVGSAMASMPHYIAPGVNELTAKMIEGGVHALQKTIDLSITGVQELVIFAVNMMLSTYVCLITLVITGAASIVLDATQEIMTGLNDTIKGIVNGIDSAVSDFQNSVNSLVQKADKVGSVFGTPLTVPTLSLPGLNDLQNLKIPSKYMDGITSLQKSLDNFTFDDVKNAAEDAIKIPFKLLSQRVDNELGNYQFDQSIFPVPQKEKLTFCSNNNHISDFFEDIKKTVDLISKIVLAVLIAAAILVMIPMGYLEHRKWRVTRERAYMFSYNARYDPVDVVHLAARPSSGTYGMRFASYFSSSRRQILVRWAVAYITSPPAIFVLSLGLAGLLHVLAQYIVLKRLEAAAPVLAHEIGQFAGEVVGVVNNASVKLAQTTNNAITGVTDDINKGVFSWIAEGTDTLNNTLNTLTNGIQSGIDSFLGGTPLERPATDAVRCIIGTKIENIQKALTWLHDNAKISIPLLPNDTFSKGAMNSLDLSGTKADSFLSDPEGTSSDMITHILLKLADKWKAKMSQNAAISGGVCLIWLVVVIIAIIRTLYFWWGKDKTRAEGGGVGTVFNGEGVVAMQQTQHHSMVDAPPRPTTPSPAYPGYALNRIRSDRAAALNVDNNPFNDSSYPSTDANQRNNNSNTNPSEEFDTWSDDRKDRSIFEENHVSEKHT